MTFHHFKLLSLIISLVYISQRETQGPNLECLRSLPVAGSPSLRPRVADPRSGKGRSQGPRLRLRPLHLAHGARPGGALHSGSGAQGPVRGRAVPVSDQWYCGGTFATVIISLLSVGVGIMGEYRESKCHLLRIPCIGPVF